MNILTNWEGFSDEELKKIQKSLTEEISKRTATRQDKLLQKVIDALYELQDEFPYLELIDSEMCAIDVYRDVTLWTNVYPTKKRVDNSTLF